MIQAKAKLSSAYQITLPSSLRKVLHLEAGDELDIEERKDGIFIKKALTREEQIKKVFADLDKIRAKEWQRMTPEQKHRAEMMKGWTANQYRQYIDSLPETKAYMKEKFGV